MSPATSAKACVGNEASLVRAKWPVRPVVVNKGLSLSKVSKFIARLQAEQLE